MKIFFKKVFYFLILIVFSIVVLDFFSNIFLSDNILRYTLTLKANNQNNIFKNKIIIAGDSRADRHINPIIIKKRTSIEAVNLAVAGCNIVTVRNMLEKKELTKNRLIIIGLSSPNYFDNDFKQKSSEYELAHICNLNLFNKIKYSGSNYFRDLGLIYSEFFREKLLGNLKVESFNEHKGYLPIHDKINIKEYSNDFNKHPWYINYNFNGYRKKTFEKSIEAMSRWNSKIIIYNPNVAPSWYKYVSEEVDYIEKTYSSKLKSLCEQYDNIYFFDFYNNPIENITDNDFYNMQHMNDSGATKFTINLIDTVRTLGLMGNFDSRILIDK